MSGQHLVKKEIPNMEFQENMSGGSHTIPCRRTNKWAGMKL